jgi:hypothetical protein
VAAPRTAEAALSILQNRPSDIALEAFHPRRFD